MHSMKKYKHGEIAEIILSTLLVAGFLAIAVTMPNAVQLFKYFKPKNAYDRARVKQSIGHLERRGLVMRKGGGFILTTKGARKATHYKIKSMRITRQKIWDKKWRIIMFDIPEKKRSARRAINYTLRRIGCVSYQKSVFITPFPCESEIDLVGNYFEIRKHIKLILADKIEGGDVFKKTFNI